MQAATAASAPGPPTPSLHLHGHRGGAAMSAAMSPQVAARVSRGLHHQFAGALPEPVITACPRDTVADLHRSIDGEALPQVAARLATARLTAIAQARRIRAPRSARG